MSTEEHFNAYSVITMRTYILFLSFKTKGFTPELYFSIYGEV